MNELTLNNGRGGHVPNFAAFGLKWTEAQKKAEKLDEIWRRQKDAGREQLAAQDRIRALEEETRSARARAILGGGEESDETPLIEARARVESLGQEIQDLRRAAEYGYTDLLRVVSAGRDPYREKLAGAIVRESEKVAKLEAELATRRHAMEVKAALDRWLENPEGALSVGPAPQAPLNPRAAA